MGKVSNLFRKKAKKPSPPPEAFPGWQPGSSLRTDENPSAYRNALLLLSTDCKDAALLGQAAQDLSDAFIRQEHAMGLMPTGPPPDPDNEPPPAELVLMKTAELAGELGNPKGYILVSKIYQSQGFFAPLIERDPLRAAASALCAAEMGDIEAMLVFVSLVLYTLTPEAEASGETSEVVETSQQIAKGYTDQLMEAEPDNAKYCLLAGYLANAGVGQPKDAAEARRLCTKATTLPGDEDEHRAAAHFELHIFDHQGVAGPVDKVSMLHHLHEAARLGSDRAMSNLGGMYATGRDVPKDEAKSLEWYHKAADEHNHLGAAHTLAIMYRSGEGAPLNPQLADKYENLAAELSYDESSKF